MTIISNIKINYPDGKFTFGDFSDTQFHIGYSWETGRLPALKCGRYQTVEIVEMSEDKTELWVEVVK